MSTLTGVAVEEGLTLPALSVATATMRYAPSGVASGFAEVTGQLPAEMAVEPMLVHGVALVQGPEPPPQ